METIFGSNKKSWQKIKTRGPHPRPEGGGAPAPLGAPPSLVGPLVLHRPQLQLYIFTFGEKKTERRIHRVLRYEAAAKP